MDDIYVEPDPGQKATIEIDDYNDFVYSSFKYGVPVMVGDIKVKVLEYVQLSSLKYTSGHRAKVTVERTF